MKLLDIAGAEFTPLGDEVEQPFQRILMRLNDLGDQIRVPIGGLSGDIGRIDPAPDQDFGSASLERIDALDDPCFDRPFAGELGGECLLVDVRTLI